MPPLVVWIDAIVLGSIWVMVASGLVLVYGIMGILNFAHGQFYMLGALMVYLIVVRAGAGYLVAVVVSAVSTAIIGAVVEKYLMRPVAIKGFAPAAILTIGMIFVFEGIAVLVFGPSMKAVPSVFPGVLKFGEATVSAEKMAVVGLALIVMAGLYLVIMRTRFGITVRAAAQDPGAANLFGVDPGRLTTIVMAMGCGLAGLAGAFMAPVYYNDPWMGGTPLLMSILAIVIGGLGSLGGAVIGGFLLGAMASLVAWYIGPWSQFVAFMLVIIIIIFRPQGLFGVPPE